MQIDVIVGNPPYGRTDIHMKFAIESFRISSRFTCLIIPAKWQCKGDGVKTGERLYTTFREEVEPYIKDIVYYIDSIDIFLIAEPAGISIHLTDKNKEYKEKKIENVCSLNHRYNTTMERRFNTQESTLNNRGQEIIDKLKYDRETYKPSLQTPDKQYQFWCNALITGVGDFKVVDGGLHRIMSTKTGMLQLLAIGKIYTLEEYKSNEIKDNYNLLFSSNNLEEVKSFISYVYSRFTRFLIFNSICGLRSTGQDTWWRFVPNEEFNHMFTDEELYKKHNLSDKDIELIENTISIRAIHNMIGE